MPIEPVEIRPTQIADVAGYHKALDVVAQERRYLCFLKAPPMRQVRAFVDDVIRRGGVHLVAVQGKRVVGWCDIYPFPDEGFHHVGRVGLGVLPEHRGDGLGRRLMVEAVGRALAGEISRVELDVFASNTRAKALYDDLGFRVEGVKRRARFIDGEWDDRIMMALLREEVGE